MIEIGGATLDFSDPVILGLGVVGVLLLVLILVILRGTRRSVHASEPVMQQMMLLGETVRGLSDGQHQLFGGLKTVVDGQSDAQTRMIQTMELRLAETGEATFSSRKGRDVWLRLHNNTHWAIQFRTASMYLSSEIWHTPDHGICALADGAEVGLIYYLEDEEGKRTCMGGGGCMSSTAWLIPGRSLIFSVPRKALRKSEQICVVFTYEWETYKSFPSYSPTEHAVRFSSQLGLEK